MDGRKPQENFAANEEPELKKFEREREREIKGFLFVRRKSEVTRHVTVLLPAFATVLLNSERRRRLAFSIQKQAGDRATLRRRRSEFSVERKETDSVTHSPCRQWKKR